MFEKAAELAQWELQGSAHFLNSGCAGSPGGEGRNKDSSKGLFMTGGFFVVVWLVLCVCACVFGFPKLALLPVTQTPKCYC